MSVDVEARSDRAGKISATTSVLRVLPDDGLTRQHLTRAIAASSTARELIARVEQLQDCVLILRAHPLLTQQEHLLGRGQFWVVRGHLYGLLGYQAEPLGSHRAMRIINHELAHALEVGRRPAARTPRVCAGWSLPVRTKRRAAQ